MTKPSSLKLSEKKVEHNISHIKGLKSTNELIERTLHEEINLEAETRDLFYFYTTFGQYLKHFVQVPKLRPQHDRRVQFLEEILNGLDLTTIEEDETIPLIRKAFKDSPGGLSTMKLDQRIVLYEALRGELFTERLYGEKLKENLKSRGYLLLALNLIPIIGQLFAYMDYDDIYRMDYNPLEEKAKRTDFFLSRYRDKLK